MICFVQYLYYESSKGLAKKELLKCEKCPFKDNCKDEAKEEKK